MSLCNFLQNGDSFFSIFICNFRYFYYATNNKEPDEYAFQGVLWNSGKGICLVLPDTASGEWSFISADETAGIIGGVVHNGADVTITVYAGRVSYEPSLQGIYNYVREKGFREAAFVSCNGTEAVRFVSGDTSEINLAFPWQDEVIQVTVKASDNETKAQYADWIFSSAHIATGDDFDLYDKLTGSLTEETAYIAMKQYVQELFQSASLSDISIERVGRTGEYYIFSVSYGTVRKKLYVKATNGDFYKEDFSEDGSSKGYGTFAGIIFGYLPEKEKAAESGSQDNVPIDSEAAYDAVYQYIDETLGADKIYKYNGYITMDSETEDEYVIMVRSYTGAIGKFYVQKETGDVSVVWKSPVTNELDRQYLFTIGRP